MNFIDRYDNLARIAQYIRFEKTGNPKELAKKCEISLDTLHDQIDILRQIAARDFAQIKYCRVRETYYFKPSGRFANFEFLTDNA